MTRSYIKTVLMGEGKSAYNLDLFADDDLIKDSSYVMRAYRALAALKKGENFSEGTTIQAFLPRYESLEETL